MSSEVKAAWIGLVGAIIAALIGVSAIFLDRGRQQEATTPIVEVALQEISTPQPLPTATAYPPTNTPDTSTTDSPTVQPTSIPTVEIVEINGELSPSDTIKGIWDYQISAYQEVGSDGFIQNKSHSAIHTIELLISDDLVSGRFLGAKDACSDASILGTKEGNNIEYIITYTGSCCQGEQMKFVGVIDPETMSLTGELEPEKIPETNCRLWYANVIGQMRDPFPDVYEFLNPTDDALSVSTNFEDGIWDFDITVSQSMTKGSMIVDSSEFHESIVELNFDGRHINGKLIGATDRSCNEASIQGWTDGETVKYVYTNTSSSCCTGEQSLFEAKINLDGTIMTGTIQPAKIPATTNCNMWYADFVATKR